MGEINLKTNKISTIVTVNETAPLKITLCLLIGIFPAINALSPNKAATLKMLDPIIIPTPTSCCPINNAVTADEISGVSAPNAVIMPSSPPDRPKCILSFSRLPPRMKLEIVIRAKHKINMLKADTIVINATSYVLSCFHFQLRISGISSPCLSMYCLCSMSLSCIICFK